MNNINPLVCILAGIGAIMMTPLLIAAIFTPIVWAFVILYVLLKL